MTSILASRGWRSIRPWPRLQQALKWELICPQGPWKGLDDVEFVTLGYLDRFNRRRLHGEITNDKRVQGNLLASESTRRRGGHPLARAVLEHMAVQGVLRACSIPGCERFVVPASSRTTVALRGGQRSPAYHCAAKYRRPDRHRPVGPCGPRCGSCHRVEGWLQVFTADDPVECRRVRQHPRRMCRRRLPLSRQRQRLALCPQCCPADRARHRMYAPRASQSDALGETSRLPASIGRSGGQPPAGRVQAS